VQPYPAPVVLPGFTRALDHYRQTIFQGVGRRTVRVMELAAAQIAAGGSPRCPPGLEPDRAAALVDDLPAALRVCLDPSVTS
jgi:hypothetical protein